MSQLANLNLLSASFEENESNNCHDTQDEHSNDAADDQTCQNTIMWLHSLFTSNQDNRQHKTTRFSNYKWLF